MCMYHVGLPSFGRANYYGDDASTLVTRVLLPLLIFSEHLCVAYILVIQYFVLHSRENLRMA